MVLLCFKIAKHCTAIDEEVNKLKGQQLPALEAAGRILKSMIVSPTYPEFMSLEAYKDICTFNGSASKL